MYTNKINGMKYIGQTICHIKKRHSEHLKWNNSYIDRALRKYGEENFLLEVIEDGIDDADKLNELEIHYIEKYDTFKNGYNLTKGGCGSSTFPNDVGKMIITEIKNSAKSFKEIGRMFNCSIYTVSDINIGNTCYQKEETYPIRKGCCTQKYNQDNLDCVVSLLKDTDFSFKKIADLTNLPFHYVCDVNRGRINGGYSGVQIPIRPYLIEKPKVTKELTTKIISMLKEYDKSAEEIARELEIPTYTVGQINRGKSSICKTLNETFPIQKRQYRNKETAQKICAKLTEKEVLEIADLLLYTSLSTEEISRRYGVTKTLIDRINRIVVWKNVLCDFYAPIRTNPRNKKSQ